jgi:WD40 repeat protein
MWGHKDRVWSVDACSDGRRIVSSSQDGTIRVWDARSAEALHVLTGNWEGFLLVVAFSIDGTRFVSGAGSDVRVWDTESCTPLLQASQGEHTTPVHSVAFSPSGKRIIGASAFQTCTWDAASGQCLNTVQNPEYLPNDLKLRDTIGITQLGFIVDFRTGRTISKLPPMLPRRSITAAASTANSLALGTDTGRVFIIHFPPVLFASPEIQTSTLQDVSNTDDLLPLELYCASHRVSVSPLVRLFSAIVHMHIASVNADKRLIGGRIPPFDLP